MTLKAITNVTRDFQKWHHGPTYYPSTVPGFMCDRTQP